VVAILGHNGDHGEFRGRRLGRRGWIFFLAIRPKNEKARTMRDKT